LSFFLLLYFVQPRQAQTLDRPVGSALTCWANSGFATMNLTTQCSILPFFSSLLSSQIYGIVSHLIGLRSSLQKKERKKEGGKIKIIYF